MLARYTVSLALSFVAVSALAQPAESPAVAPADPAQPKLQVQSGPMSGALADVATVKVPEGFGFVDKSQMPLFNKLTGNLDNPKDLGAIIAEGGWLVFFTWDPIGYVKDDEKDELDADGMLETFKEGNEMANEERRRQGFDPLYTVGWETPPFYDAKTNNLTWALRNRSGEATGDEARYNINHEVRLLGRDGVMAATLVGDPEAIPQALPKLASILEGFAFNPGKTYAEYRQGDKIAQYGLTGLVLGGGALLAAKTGLFSQLGKFIKLIVVGAIAGVAGLAKLFKRRFNGQ